MFPLYLSSCYDACDTISNEKQTINIRKLKGNNRFILEDGSLLQLAGVSDVKASADYFRKTLIPGDNTFILDQNGVKDGAKLCYVYKNGVCLNSYVISHGIVPPDLSYLYDSIEVYKEVLNRPVIAAPNPVATTQSQKTFAELYDVLKSSVVVVNSQYGSQSMLGTGFFIDSIGTIISNHHVYNSNYSGYIELETGDQFRISQILQDNEALDYVVFRIENPNNIKFNPVKIVTNNSKKGEPVLIIGHPEGMKFTVTKGIITNINQGMRPDDIMIDAAVNHGNSGGPLFNMNGEVIGLVTYKRSNECELCGFALDIRKIH